MISDRSAGGGALRPRPGMVQSRSILPVRGSAPRPGAGTTSRWAADARAGAAAQLQQRRQTALPRRTFGCLGKAGNPTERPGIPLQDRERQRLLHDAVEPFISRDRLLLHDRTVRMQPSSDAARAQGQGMRKRELVFAVRRRQVIARRRVPVLRRMNARSAERFCHGVSTQPLDAYDSPRVRGHIPLGIRTMRVGGITPLRLIRKLGAQRATLARTGSWRQRARCSGVYGRASASAKPRRSTGYPCRSGKCAMIRPPHPSTWIASRSATYCTAGPFKLAMMRAVTTSPAAIARLVLSSKAWRSAAVSPCVPGQPELGGCCDAQLPVPKQSLCGPTPYE